MLAYTPFLDPLPVTPYWWVVMIILVVLVSLAYKAIKLPDFTHLIRHTVVMSTQIVVFMLAAGLIISLIVAFA